MNCQHCQTFRSNATASSVAPEWDSRLLRSIFAQTGEAPGVSPVTSIDCLALTMRHLVTKVYKIMEISVKDVCVFE